MVKVEDLTHLSAKEVQSIHDSILEDYPGLKGSKPGLSVEAVVGRIHHNLFYGSFHGIEEVAALYAEAIARGHVFNDGNKRTALISMLTFLEENGVYVDADQEQIADKIVDLADGRTSHKELAPWLKSRLRGELPAEAIT